MRYSKVDEEVLKILKDVVGPENVRVEEDYLERYSKDETSLLKPSKPDVVVFAENTVQVSKILKIANDRMIPVVPRGAGTGLSGGAVPVFGGIVLSLEKMNKILEFDPVNMTVTVQPGVITDEIQKVAEEHGLYYAGDPASSESSSIGGNVAENAGGTRVIKYGPTSNHVLGLEVVLPTGEIVRYGGKMVKNVMGYDMVRLFVGSEGTLGIVTEITLRLIPKPRYFALLLAPFSDLKKAVYSVPEILSRMGELPSSIELMDRRSVEISSKFLNEEIPHMSASAHLIVEISDNVKSVLEERLISFGEELERSGAIEVYVAQSRHSRMNIWKFRKAIAEGIIAFRPVHCMEDLSVPISEIPNLIDRSIDIASSEGLEVLNFGHVGDGNVHTTFLKPPDMDDEEWERSLENALLNLYEYVSSVGGSITGEHGVGLKRREFLKIFMKEEEINAMRAIKRSLDPNNILNPGKIFQE